MFLLMLYGKLEILDERLTKDEKGKEGGLQLGDLREGDVVVVWASIERQVLPTLARAK